MIKITTDKPTYADVAGLIWFIQTEKYGLYCNKDETQFYYFYKYMDREILLEIIPYSNHISMVDIDYSDDKNGTKLWSKYSGCCINNLQAKPARCKLSMEIE